MADIKDPFNKFNTKFNKDSLEDIKSAYDNEAFMADEMFREYMRNKNYHSHIFTQVFEDPNNKWYEITLEELQNIYPYAKEPKFYNKKYWFAKIENETGDYLLFQELGLLIIYNNIRNTYEYIRSDEKCVEEEKLYKDRQSLIEAIKKAEKEKEGTINEIIYEKTKEVDK